MDDAVAIPRDVLRDIARLMDLLCGGILIDPDLPMGHGSRRGDAYDTPFKLAQAEWGRLSRQKEACALAHRIRAAMRQMGDAD